MQLMAVKKKVIRAAAVTPEGASVLKRVADEYGMKEYVVAGKLFDWFGRQDDVFQRAVLGLLKGLEHDAAREFMRRLGEPADVLVKGSPGGKAAKKSDPSAESTEKTRAHTPAQR